MHASASAAPITEQVTPEIAAVRQAFGEYKAALKARDGERAAEAVSRNSFAYYDRMRALARTATREELAELEGTERMLALSLRLQAPPELLANATPEELVSYAVTSATMTDTGVAKTELGEIRFKDGLARAQMVIDDQPTPNVLQFQLEFDRWKFDLEFAMKASAGFVAAIAQQSGKTEDEVILMLLEQGAQRPVGSEIWQPPVSK